MSKLLISLIHNNEEMRLSYIKPHINKLVSDLKETMNVQFLEISQQPDLEPVSLRLGFFRNLMYWKLNREWMSYKKTANKFFLYSFLVFIFNSIKTYAFNPNISKKWLKSCAIEMIVTDKHIRAFANALENKADYLLVFEDDAVFKDDSINKLLDLLKELDTDKKPTYIDLAGGCDFDDLGIDKIESKRNEKFRYYSKPVTNTACCYLVNQKQLEQFNYFLTRKPTLRYIGIDWLLNKLFILQSKKNILSNCRHSDPPIFSHGSVTGEFKPWVR